MSIFEGRAERRKATVVGSGVGAARAMNAARLAIGPPLTHGRHDVLFVTDGIESALKQAREAGSVGDVSIGGGAGTINQYLKAGYLGDLRVHIAPFTIGAGEPLLDGVAALHLKPAETGGSRRVTRIRYVR